MESNTDVQEVFDELGAGSFKPALESIMSKVALAVMVHGSEKPSGSVKLDLTFARTSDTEQLALAYKMSHTLPTVKGKRSEEIRGASVFFVAKGGRICVDAPQEIWNGQVEMFGGES